VIPVPDHTEGTPFGARSRLWSCSRNSTGEGIHTGVDYPAPIGTEIVAARPGIVVWDDHGPDFGNHQLEIRCDDADGGGRDFYAHMSARLAAPGTRVATGQPIGRVGAEGNVTGPHLHFERHSVASGPWGCSTIRDPQPSLDFQEDDMADPATQAQLDAILTAAREAVSQIGQLRSAEAERARNARKRDAALLDLVEALGPQIKTRAGKSQLDTIKTLLQEHDTEETTP